MLTVCISGRAYKIITQHANRDGSVTNTEEGYIYCDARMYKCKLFLSINRANQLIGINTGTREVDNPN